MGAKKGWAWLFETYWDEAGYPHKNWTYPPIWIGLEYLTALVFFIIYVFSRCTP